MPPSKPDYCPQITCIKQNGVCRVHEIYCEEDKVWHVYWVECPVCVKRDIHREKAERQTSTQSPEPLAQQREDDKKRHWRVQKSIGKFNSKVKVKVFAASFRSIDSLARQYLGNNRRFNHAGNIITKLNENVGAIHHGKYN